MVDDERSKSPTKKLRKIDLLLQHVAAGGTARWKRNINKYRNLWKLLCCNGSFIERNGTVISVSEGRREWMTTDWENWTAGNERTVVTNVEVVSKRMMTCGHGIVKEWPHSPVGKHEVKRPLGINSVWEDNINMDLKRLCINWSQGWYFHNVSFTIWPLLFMVGRSVVATNFFLKKEVASPSETLIFSSKFYWGQHTAQYQTHHQFSLLVCKHTEVWNWVTWAKQLQY